MKGNEKLYRILAIFSVLMLLNNIFNNSVYISRLIKTIDKATDIVLIVNDVEVNTFLFDKVIPEFVYGEIVDINKPWDYLLGKGSKKYSNTNIKIHYLKDDKIIGKAQVFTSYDSNDEYIFFMKNIYYKSNKSFNSLVSPYLSRNITDTPYMWQPFTPETNEIRDMTFYIKDGKVAALEIIEPYELRHVYGYDRDAGLQYANVKREAL